MIKTCIYLIFSISVLGTSIIAPAMGMLSTYFAGENETLIKLILTIPALTVIISCYFAIPLAAKYGKKNIVLLSLFIYAFAGCASAFSENIYSMLLWRALLGVGIGFLTPLSQTLPADFFTGEERQETYAKSGSSISLGNVTFITLAGFLASYSWRYSFAIYLVGFIVMLFVFYFLPNKATITSKTCYKDINQSSINTLTLDKRIYYVGIALFFFMSSVFVLFTNLAILIDERNLGTPTLAGYILATNSFCSFFVSYNLVKLRKKFGKFLYPLIPFFVTCAHCTIYFATSAKMLFLAQILNAIAMGIALPLASILIAEFSNEKNSVKGMAVMTVSIFLGQLASPFISSYLPVFSGIQPSGAVFLSVGLFAFIVFIAFTFKVLFSIKKQ